MDFARILREAMGDMSQAELADRSGLRQATISRLLDGSRKPSYESLMLLERTLPVLRQLRDKAVA